MRISDAGIALIKRFEGCRLVPYQCSAGVWTDGWGNTSGVQPGKSITQEQADLQLKMNLRKFEMGVEELVKVELTQPQFDALVSLTFNIGLGNFKTSTMLKMLNQLNYEGAAVQFARWNRAGGMVLNGLTTRRNAEAELFRSGTHG